MRHPVWPSPPAACVLVARRGVVRLGVARLGVVRLVRLVRPEAARLTRAARLARGALVWLAQRREARCVWIYSCFRGVYHGLFLLARLLGRG